MQLSGLCKASICPVRMIPVASCPLDFFEPSSVEMIEARSVRPHLRARCSSRPRVRYVDVEALEVNAVGIEPVG